MFREALGPEGATPYIGLYDHIDDFAEVFGRR
jgi:hypothetical protein